MYIINWGIKFTIQKQKLITEAYVKRQINYLKGMDNIGIWKCLYTFENIYYKTKLCKFHRKRCSSFWENNEKC